jgi:hypothetical protein
VKGRILAGWAQKSPKPWFKTAWITTDHSKGIYRIVYPNPIKENRRMSTCNRLDLQTLGSQPLCPKISGITVLGYPLGTDTWRSYHMIFELQGIRQTCLRWPRFLLLI